MFGFPNVNRGDYLYNNNFLKSVIFQVQFNPTNYFHENKSSIKKLFAEKLPIANEEQNKEYSITFTDKTPIVQSIETGVGSLRYSSENGEFTLSIQNNTISYTIAGDEYSKFEDFNDELSKITSLLESAGINELTRIAIRKINVVEYALTEETDIPIHVLEFLISPQLLSNLHYFPYQKGIRKKLHLTEYANGEYRLNLHYGLVSKQDNTGDILIDIDCFKIGITTLEKSLEQFREINTEVFKVFNWAISKKAKDYLKKNE